MGSFALACREQSPVVLLGACGSTRTRGSADRRRRTMSINDIDQGHSIASCCPDGKPLGGGAPQSTDQSSTSDLGPDSPLRSDKLKARESDAGGSPQTPSRFSVLPPHSRGARRGDRRLRQVMWSHTPGCPYNNGGRRLDRTRNVRSRVMQTVSILY